VFSCKIGGVERVIGTLQHTPEQISVVAAAAMIEHAERVMALSGAQVPRGTGTLADSAYVGIPIVTADAIMIQMGYGGPNDKVNPNTGEAASEYAVPVHERVEVPHETGKAKFLEDPLNETAVDLLEAVGRRIRALL
jgi:hypothetical protein